MGTRCLVNVFESRPNAPAIKDQAQLLVTIYRQFDGYPTGMGADIKRILGDTEVVNGFGIKRDAAYVSNGAGCAAAYLIEKLKEAQTGNVYIYPPGSKAVGEEYTYNLFIAADKPIWVEVFSRHGPAWFGTLKDLDPVIFGRLN